MLACAFLPFFINPRCLLVVDPFSPKCLGFLLFNIFSIILLQTEVRLTRWQMTGSLFFFLFPSHF